MVQTPITPTLYPDSDGRPMADNTVQYRWIVRLVTNLRRLLKDQVAFVAGDLLWYPRQAARGETPVSQAPDVMVVLGRPDSERGSYKQWEEDNIAPQVVFEIISPSNSSQEMADKQIFYAEHGVLEMFFYNPQSRKFWAFVRENAEQDCSMIIPLHLPWISPILGIKFELFEDGLAVSYPDGELFKDPGEFADERDQLQQERDEALLAEQQAQQERNAARIAEQQAQAAKEQAFAKLRELGIDPDTL